MFSRVGMASFGAPPNLTHCDVYRKVQSPRKPPQGMEGTGDNRGNGETFSLFPLSPLAKDPAMHPIHEAQSLGYMKLLDIPLG